MKKWITLIASALLVGVASWAIAAESQFGAPQRRAQRKARPAVERNAPPQRVAVKEGDSQLYGINAYKSDYGITSTYTGPFAIDSKGSHVKKSTVSIAALSGCYFKGNIVSMSYDDKSSKITYAVYNADTWELVRNTMSFTFTSPYTRAVDLCYDPTSDRVYGCFVENSVRVEKTSPAKLMYITAAELTENVMFVPTEVAVLDRNLRALTCDGDGSLYGIGFDGKLYSIDKSTGTMTEKASLTFPAVYDPDYEEDLYLSNPGLKGSESADMVWGSDYIYFSLNDNYGAGYIVKINKSDGSMSLVYNAGYSSYQPAGDDSYVTFSTLYFKQDKQISASTPEAPTNVRMSPVGTALQASLNFTMPSKDIKGGDLSGDLTYYIKTSSATLASGTAAPGAEVKDVKVTVPAAGMTDLMVSAAVADAESLPVTVSAFIGPDTPVIPLDINTDVADLSVTVEWEPASGEYGGNTDAVTYKVVRQPGNVAVATTQETSAVDNLTKEEKTQYWYEITPVAGAITGPVKTSRKFFAGRYFELPHFNMFDTADLFNEYPVIDNNRDGNTWWVDTRTTPQRQCAAYTAGSKAADDYLCVGPFSLKAGAPYSFTATADCHSNPETVEVLAGTNPDNAASFSTTVVAKTIVSVSSTGVLLEGRFTPSADGLYYFGIHVTSDSGRELWIKDVKISGLAANAPKALTDLTAEGLKDGVRLTGKLPAFALDGSKANLTAVNVYRDGLMVTTVKTGIADGADFSYDDKSEAAEGKHSYTLVAVNANGEGEPASVEGYRGLDLPGYPRNLRVWEDANTPGLIHATWEPPTSGVNGGFPDPENCTYDLDFTAMSNDASMVKENYSGLSCDFQIPDQFYTKQDLISVTVASRNAKGPAGYQGNSARHCYYGPADKLPVYESFANGKYEQLWSSERVVDNDNWDGLWDAFGTPATGIDAPDGDAYSFGYMAYAANIPWRATGPRVTLEGTDKPTLAFWYYCTDEAASFTLDVIDEDKLPETLKTFDLSASGRNKWIRYEMSLDKFKNSKYIQISFLGSSKTEYVYPIVIDNFSIIDSREADLAVRGFSGPSKANAGSRARFTLNVRNNGSKPVSSSDFSVVLMRNGKDVATTKGCTLESGDEAPIDIADIPEVTDPVKSVYSARIEFDKDLDKSNNTSGEVEVEIVKPTYPAPENLSASGGNGVTLTWKAPDPDDNPANTVTENFDSYRPFIIDNIGDWKTVDLDGCKTSIPATFLGPCTYDHVGEPMAWQIIDPAQANIFSWYAVSGEQLLAAFQANSGGSPDVDSNDWLISPRLCGKAQTISFMANAATSQRVPETFDVYYSTTSDDVDDFILLEQGLEVNVTNNWTEFRFKLPKGALYFAIVHRSNGKFALLLDDIVYAPEGATTNKIVLKGFNVYRDGERVNNELIAPDVTTYHDANVEPDRVYSYCVTAMWDAGESDTSNIVTLNSSDALDTIVEAVRPTIVAVEGAVRVSTPFAMPVAVYTAAGATMASRVVDGTATISLTPGIYIVRAGSVAAKVAVR